MTRTDGNIMKYRDKFAKVPLRLIDDFGQEKKGTGLILKGLDTFHPLSWYISESDQVITGLRIGENVIQSAPPTPSPKTPPPTDTRQAPVR